MATEEKKDGAKDKMAIDDSAFEKLEMDFQDVLKELMGDRSLERFRSEYEKLHRALKKSHESEKRLMQKCRELNAEIVSNSAKVATALKLSQEDQSTIASLKKEIEKAWKLVDGAHEKETRAKETIQSLKLEIANLSKLVEQGAGLTMGQEHSVNELLKMKEQLTKERDEALNEVVKFRETLSKTQEQLQETEREQDESTKKIQDLQSDIQVKTNEINREQRKKDKLERDIKQIRADLEKRNSDIKEKDTQIDKLKNDISKSEQQARENKIALERANKESEKVSERLTLMQKDFEQQLIISEQLQSDNQEKVKELKSKEEEIKEFKKDINKLKIEKDKSERKIHVIEDQKKETDGQRDRNKAELINLEKEMEIAKKEMDSNRKEIDSLIRERDLLNKNVLKSNYETEKQINLVKTHEQSKKSLEQEIQNYKDEAQKQRKIIYQLEKERDRYINEASDLTQKVLVHMEDVKVREMQIFDYKKKIAESETKLKQQQNLYEAVRSDRNLYSKNLIESQDEITEMKRKLKIMNHQIDQLKEEISGKETKLVAEHAAHQSVEKEKDKLKVSLKEMANKAQEFKAHIDSQEAEHRKLDKIILEADAEKLRQKKELDQVISERDILGTQLVRRNDELALLYEKIKIQQSTLNKGEAQYNQRLEDIRVLKLEIRKLRREKQILQKSVANVDDMRKEVYHLQRELLRERTRCKALEEELENPMNIHRWRKLEGSDPSTYEMIQKIQTLQKRLITKTEEVVEKELLIQEKERLYVELKHILARQPGPEVAEQLHVYQQTLKEKTKQMKAMSSELNMYESQVNEYKYEVERLARQLHEVKKKYFISKKKEQIGKEYQQTKQIMPQNKEQQARFTGGGFSLKQTTANA